MKILMLVLLIFIIQFSLYPIILFADEMRIAVMDLTPDGVSRPVAKRVAELIRTEIVNIGQLTVINRTLMYESLEEQGFRQRDCTDQSCAVKIGKLLSANKILIGSVMKLGKRIVIAVRIIDVEKGNVEFGEKQDAKSIDDLYRAVELLTKKLHSRIRGKRNEEYAARRKPERERTPRGEYYSPGLASISSLVPFWSGSFYPYYRKREYHRMPVFGILLAVGKSAAFITSGYFLVRKYDKMSDADDHKFFDEDEQAVKAEEQADEFGSKANTFLVIWAGITLVDVIFSGIYINNYNESNFYVKRNKAGFQIIALPRYYYRDGVVGMDGLDLGCTLRL